MGKQSADKVKLTYFDGPGRAEIARLILAAGGVEFEDNRLAFEDWGKLKPTTKFGQMPVLYHGSFELAQSQAIAMYCASLGNLTEFHGAKERAVDAMFLGALAEAQTIQYKCLFGDDAGKAAGKEALPAAAAALLGNLEKLVLPGGGFVQGAATPSVADLVLFNMVTSPFPGFRALGVDTAPYPNITAVVDAVAAFPPVAKYLEAAGNYHKAAPKAEGKYTLEVEITACNVKKIDMKAYGVEKACCCVKIHCAGQTYESEMKPGLDPYWEHVHTFKINDPAVDKFTCEFFMDKDKKKIGETMIPFDLSTLLKNQARFCGHVVPGGKVDYMLKAVDFGNEEAPEEDDTFMDFCGGSGDEGGMGMMESDDEDEE